MEDITKRAITTLNAVDYILAEDTRTSGKLLKTHAITTPLKSYHSHNEQAMIDPVIAWLNEGKNLALISDAGTPLISDPGERVIKAVKTNGYNVVSIPGPSALISALITSGIETHPFTFYGFLPQKSSARDKILKTLVDHPYTMIFYESPNRIHKTLEAMHLILGNRTASIARELTKLYEETIQLSLREFEALPPLKGEIVLVVEGSKEAPLQTGDMLEHVSLLMEDGLREMDAIKRVAKLRNLKKNTVYMAVQKSKTNPKNEERDYE